MGKKNIESLKFVDGRQQHINTSSESISESSISGLPVGKDLLNCSSKELQDIKIDTRKETKSLEEFDVTDGKNREEKQKEIKRVKELEDLLGFKDMNPYGTLSKEIFAEKLSVMSLSDMYELAGRVGIPASGTSNRSLLKKSLLKSFDIYAQKHNVTVQGQAKPIIDKSSPNYESVVRLFNE